jgi:hypothetical protein
MPDNDFSRFMINFGLTKRKRKTIWFI